MNIMLLLMFSFFNDYRHVNIDSSISRTKNPDVKVCYLNNELMYYDNFIDTDCNIYLHSKAKRYTLHINKDYNNFNLCNQMPISNITAYKDTLFFIASKELLKYCYNSKTDSIEFVSHTNLDEMFNQDILYYARNIFLDYPNLIGYTDIFISKALDKNDMLYYFRINLQDNSIKKFKKIDYPSGLYWAVYQPRNIIDFSKKSYLVTDITEYKIRIYDYNDSLLSKIDRELPFWQATTYDNYKFSGWHPIKIIDVLSNDTNTKTLIHRVNFLSDSLILVCYSNRQEDSDKIFDLFYDIWEKQGETWQLKNKDLASDKILEKYKIDLSANYIILNNTLIFSSFENDIYKLNMVEYGDK